MDKIKNKKLRILADILFIILGLAFMYFFWKK